MKINKYKKGDVLLIKTLKGGGQILTSGVIFDISKSQITLMHNFSKKTVVDKTVIFVKDIIQSEIINPKELNSISDLSDYA